MLNQESSALELKTLDSCDFDWVLVWKRGNVTTQLPSPPVRPLSTRTIVVRALKRVLGFGIKKFLGF